MFLEANNLFQIHQSGFFVKWSNSQFLHKYSRLNNSKNIQHLFYKSQVQMLCHSETGLLIYHSAERVHGLYIISMVKVMPSSYKSNSC